MHDTAPLGPAHAHPGGGARRRHRETIPRILLRAIFGLMLFSIVAVLVARGTGVGLMLTPEGEPAETRLLQFDERADGRLFILDHPAGAQVALIPADDGGFIRGVLRGLSRGRALERMESTQVYLLTRWDDGRLSISDPATGQSFDLNSFGVDNLRIFAQLLESQGGTGDE